MLRKFAYNKIFRTTGILFLFILLLLFPASKEYSLEDEYKTINTIKNVQNTEVFLLDKSGYVSRCFVNISYSNKMDYANKIIELLIMDGKYIDKIPNGFTTIIPSDTIINSIEFDKDIIILDLSKQFIQQNNINFKKSLELLTYNLTNINDVNSVYLKIEGKLLEKTPDGINIKQPLTRKDGVNQINEINNYENTFKTTIYFVGKNSTGYYYIPVTKLNNDSREKIKIIIDELSSSKIYNNNLMSFLNYNIKLNDYKIEKDKILLDFNNFLFDDINSKSILEEVIYSVALSIKENYNINEVIFNVNGKEITKSVLKNIE